MLHLDPPAARRLGDPDEVLLGTRRADRPGEYADAAVTVLDEMGRGGRGGRDGVDRQGRRR
jgi:hypothetical protein